MLVSECQNCEIQFKANDDQGGTKVNCSKCGQRLLIPAAVADLTSGNVRVLGVFHEGQQEDVVRSGVKKVPFADAAPRPH